MPKDFTPSIRAALRADVIAPVECLQLFCDEEVLRCSSSYRPFSYDGNDSQGVQSFEAMGGRWSTNASELSIGNINLEPEPLQVSLDASKAFDTGETTDFANRFWRHTWHRRRAIFTVVATVPESDGLTPIAEIFRFEGDMDFRDDEDAIGAPERISLSIESATFQYNGRNMQTRTDENQKRLFPGDTFFSDVGLLIGREIPWNRDWVNVKTAGGAVTYAVDRWGRPR